MCRAAPRSPTYDTNPFSTPAFNFRTWQPSAPPPMKSAPVAAGAAISAGTCRSTAPTSRASCNAWRRDRREALRHFQCRQHRAPGRRSGAGDALFPVSIFAPGDRVWPSRRPIPTATSSFTATPVSPTTSCRECPGTICGPKCSTSMQAAFMPGRTSNGRRAVLFRRQRQQPERLIPMRWSISRPAMTRAPRAGRAMSRAATWPTSATSQPRSRLKSPPPSRRSSTQDTDERSTAVCGTGCEGAQATSGAPIRNDDKAARRG